MLTAACPLTAALAIFKGTRTLTTPIRSWSSDCGAGVPSFQARMCCTGSVLGALNSALFKLPLALPHVASCCNTSLPQIASRLKHTLSPDIVHSMRSVCLADVASVCAQGRARGWRSTSLQMNRIGAAFNAELDRQSTNLLSRPITVSYTQGRCMQLYCGLLRQASRWLRAHEGLPQHRRPKIGCLLPHCSSLRGRDLRAWCRQSVRCVRAQSEPNMSRCLERDSHVRNLTWPF